MVKCGVVSPSEVASTRYGGNDFNGGSIVLDLKGRKLMKELDRTVPKPQPALPAEGNQEGDE